MSTSLPYLLFFHQSRNCSATVVCSPFFPVEIPLINICVTDSSSFLRSTYITDSNITFAFYQSSTSIRYYIISYPSTSSPLFIGPPKNARPSAMLITFPSSFFFNLSSYLVLHSSYPQSPLVIFCTSRIPLTQIDIHPIPYFPLKPTYVTPALSFLSFHM